MWEWLAIDACSRRSMLAICAVALICGCEPQYRNEVTGTRQDADATSTTQSETSAPSLLLEASAGYYQLPWLTIKNVDQCVAEINQRSITRLELQRVDATLLTQVELLRRLGATCPGLQAVSIQSWTFSVNDLRQLLEDLPRLEELRLSSCRVSGGTDRSQWAAWKSSDLNLTYLSISNCHEIDNQAVTALLTRTPHLEELHLAVDGAGTGTVMDGTDWPWNRLTNLRKLSLASATDLLVRQALAEAANLRTLELWGCDQIKCDGWGSAELTNIEELGFHRCENLTGAAVSAFLRRTPRLKSLEVHRHWGATAGELDLAPLVELRELSVMGYQLNGLETASNLQTLNIFNTIIDGGGYDFSNLSQLTSAAMDPPGDQTLATLPASLESLEIRKGGVSNSTLAKLLPRLVNLKSLKLTALHGGRGSADSPEAITGAGWDFAAQTKLELLELAACDYITDQLVSRITRQLPNLKSLRITDGQHLSSDGWELHRLTKLKSLVLYDLPKLQNDVVRQLPKSLVSLQVAQCPQLTGEQWELATLTQLASLEIRRCGRLTTLGTHLPRSLRTLRVQECTKLTASDLSYVGLDQLETLSFQECHQLDVDRLFAAMPTQMRSLRELNLTGCPNLSTAGWDVSPLKHSLLEIIYPEGEPSYVGGIDEANRQRLQQQLPDTKIVSG